MTEALLLLATVLSTGTDVTVAPARASVESGSTPCRCGVVEGHVRRRAGDGVAGKLVLLEPSEPGEAPTRAAYTDAEGAFRFERAAPGPARAVLFAGGATGYQRAHGQAIVVRADETVSVEFVVREVRVTGRVTRSGAPAAGLRLALERRPAAEMSWIPDGVASPPPARGPARGGTVTRKDGSFEMIAEDPGSHTLHVEPREGHGVIGCPEVEIPDSESHVLDLAVGGARVAGVVIDEQTDRPVAHARVGLTRRQGSGPGREQAFRETSNGRFTLEVEPGPYDVWVSGPGYLATRVDLNVPVGGATDLRLMIAKGKVLEGRVVDAEGAPARRVSVTAEGARGRRGFARTLEDGSFRIDGLEARTHDLAAQSALMVPSRAIRFAFAFASGAAPGAGAVELRLQLGGRLRLHVRDSGGAAVGGASASLVAVDGAPVPNLALSAAGVEDEPGVLEFTAPAGSVTLDVLSSGPPLLRGRTVVVVPSGGDAAASVTLEPAEPWKPSVP